MVHLLFTYLDVSWAIRVASYTVFTFSYGQVRLPLRCILYGRIDVYLLGFDRSYHDTYPDFNRRAHPFPSLGPGSFSSAPSISRFG